MSGSFSKSVYVPNNLFLGRISTGSVMKWLTVLHGRNTIYACASRGRISETQDGNASGRMLHASELLRVLEASIAGKLRSYYILGSHQHTRLL